MSIPLVVFRKYINTSNGFLLARNGHVTLDCAMPAVMLNTGVTAKLHYAVTAHALLLQWLVQSSKISKDKHLQRVLDLDS